MRTTLFLRLRDALGLWARSVRDSYVALLPLTFLGVLATLAQYLPLPGLQSTVTDMLGPTARVTTERLLASSQGLFGLALGLSLSVQFGRRIAAGNNELPSAVWIGLAALVNFSLWTLVLGGTPGGGVDLKSTLLGLAVGSYTPWLLIRLHGWRRLPSLQLPYESDAVFLHATRMILPLIASALVTLVLIQLWVRLALLLGPSIADLGAWVLTQLPNGGLRTAALLLFSQALWALGIHGDNVIEVALPPRFSAAALSFDPALIWRPLIDNFVHLGGSVATLGLLIALLWKAREGAHRRIAQLSLLPTLVNVNELLLFGLPVVLRPQFLLPFVLLPAGLALAGWALIVSGVLPLQTTSVHWTTPALLSGWLLTGSWKGVAWQLLVIVVSTLCYLPAVMRTEEARRQRQTSALNAACEAILDARKQHRPALLRRDQAGEIARGLLVDLRGAIGSPALYLVFQPKHRIDGSAIGAEALVRWLHPRCGEIRADVTVTLAEDGELAAELGRWVLEQACACKARWNLQGLTRATLAVNVSPLQLSVPGFADDVVALLERYALRGDEIELEITESHALPQGTILQANMTRLTRHGVRLAMDDFGMGHSSLLHLRHFRVDAIKIDGSLSREVPASEAACDIVRSIATLGRSQQLDVVAEFVETQAQRDALAALGCTLFQGYLHSAPLAEEPCLAYLLAHQGCAERPPSPRSTPQTAARAEPTLAAPR